MLTAAIHLYNHRANSFSHCPLNWDGGTIEVILLFMLRNLIPPLLPKVTQKKASTLVARVCQSSAMEDYNRRALDLG
ncbi:hypothetical protein K7X08_004716 [Anisodus acutangulus]|uniref:Uncharacterized protein n=1 Tax=Anisodus acutangulus TaxID=402998 RepID=A0A9Q1MEF5_9SOLA|nr:hypothetical protein K7X08_004716 [Anisodus acutangulus]